MKKKILIVGPIGFVDNTWSTRAKYILPDIYQSLYQDFEIHVVTTVMPGYTKKLWGELCAQFNIQHTEIRIGNRRKKDFSHWYEIIREIAGVIKPDVVTNIWAAQALSNGIGDASLEVNAKSILRIAGDEIGSRILMNTYETDPQLFAENIAIEINGLAKVDEIIVMSAWEKERVEECLPTALNTKIHICPRGVDTERFSPKEGRLKERVRTRVLYIGRRSLEKGYPHVEEAADLLCDTYEDIEFVFAGDFEPSVIKNRNYLGWVQSEDLPELFDDIDLLVLPSGTEGFPQVVAEAMAAGVPCILNSSMYTNLFSHRSEVFYIRNDALSISDAVETLHQDHALYCQISKSARELAEKYLAKEYWAKRYKRIMLGDPYDENSIMDHPMNKPFQYPLKEMLPKKLLFIVPRQIGMMGAQGAYALPDAYAKFCEVLMVSHLSLDKPKFIPIVSGVKKVQRHVELDFKDVKLNQHLCDIVCMFKPDVVHLVNGHNWVKSVPAMKVAYDKAIYVVDFKTPLLAKGRIRDRLIENGKTASKYLDRVVSLSDEIAKSWVPVGTAHINVYPLGVQLSKIPQKKWETNNGKICCRRFVYVGQLAKQRNISALMNLIAGLSDRAKEKFKLDLYGAGDQENILPGLIKELGISNNVRLMGAMDQDQLLSRLHSYDAGIAWVPNEVYGDAPSIKFLEYAAAGLVVLATNTNAHKRNLLDGFNALLFEENQKSFSLAIEQALGTEIHLESLQKNRKVISKFDWSYIARNKLLLDFVSFVKYPAFSSRCKK